MRVAGFVVAAWIVVSMVEAAPPADTLVPAATKAFFSVPRFPDADAKWEKTRLGQLIADPALDPFFEDLRRQLREKWSKNQSKLATTWEDFEQAATGEVALALIHAPSAEPAIAVIVDVTDRVPQAQQLLNKVAQDLTNQGGRRLGRRQVAGATVEVFEFPPEEAGQKPEYAYYTISNNLLIGADEIAAIDGILRRAAAPQQDTLARLPAYQSVFARAGQGARNNNPDARWFIEPIGLMAALESRRPELTAGAGAPGRPAAAAQRGAAVPPRPRKKSQAEIARDLGFGAVQGVGGIVFLPPERYDFISHTAIHAPKPWQKSMNMLAFPNSDSLEAQPWVPPDVALHLAFNIDVRQAEANFEPLFDQLFGEGEQGVWTDVKESLRDDPNGPKVDLVKDLVNNLGQRATFITDYIMPITPTSERTCLGITAADEKALALAVRKSMETDPNVKHRFFQGHDIWEMTEEAVAAPEVEIEDPNRPQQSRKPLRERVAERDQGAEEEGMPERLLPRSAVTVARGHLFIASHVDFLEKILSQDPNTSLSSQADYKLVMQEMQSLGAGQESFRLFVRQGRAVRPTYELIRVNKLPEAQTLLATAINRLLTKEGETSRTAQIDGSKLPPFEQVQRYFGLGGMFITTEPNGWFGIGFSPKDGTTQIGARPASVR
jgi:hypothetical protein